MALASINSRLAARFHQRQTSVLARSQRVADRAARRCRALAEMLAKNLEISAALATIRDQMGADLLQAALDGYRSAVQAILAALPAGWLPALARHAVRSRRVREAEGDDVPGDVSYDWDRLADPGLSRDEAGRLAHAMLFPAPTKRQARAWLNSAIPGGLSWDQRLKYWGDRTRAAMLSQTSIGLEAEENVDQLRKRLQPHAEGLAWKAQRIARTEANRVAERASRACFEGLGDVLDGLQIVAVLDQWTRPEHATRTGKIYRAGRDGVYRDSSGNALPDLPDAPNCRCMTIPVVSMPEEIRSDPALRKEFEAATRGLTPDPASYQDWWERASEKERMTAVGVKRYQAVRDRLGKDRKPEWIDFIDTDGELLPPARLARETKRERNKRRDEVETALVQRRAAFRQVASSGWLKPTRYQRLAQRGVSAGEPGGIERLRKQYLSEATAIFEPNRREQQRRWKWEAAVHEGKEVRAEMRRRLTLHGDRLRRLEAFKEEIRNGDLPEPRQRELLAQIEDIARQKRQEAIFRPLMLPKSERGRITVHYDQSVDEKTRVHFARGLEMAEGITSREVTGNPVFSHVTVILDPNARRASYRGGAITIGPGHREPVFVHELTHHTEIVLDDDAKRLVRERFADWTKGSQPRPLGGTHEDDEEYLPRTDEKDWPTSYMGKVRSGTMEPRELLTQAAQELMTNPLLFSRENPELFDFVLNILGSRR